MIAINWALLKCFAHPLENTRLPGEGDDVTSREVAKNAKCDGS